MNGNTAKIWCLSQIANLAKGKTNFVMLDLGCGDGSPVAELLHENPNISYFGVEPHKASFEKACQLLAGTTAILQNAPAYDGCVTT